MLSLKVYKTSVSDAGFFEVFLGGKVGIGGICPARCRSQGLPWWVSAEDHAQVLTHQQHIST